MKQHSSRLFLNQQESCGRVFSGLSERMISRNRQEIANMAVVLKKVGSIHGEFAEVEYEVWF